MGVVVVVAFIVKMPAEQPLTSVVAEYGSVTAEVAADSSDTNTVVGAWCRQVLHCRWHAFITDTSEIYWRRRGVVVFYAVVVNGTWLSPW